MGKIISAIILYICICSNALSQDTTQKIVRGRENSDKTLSRPYVILISADGFRYDFAKKYEAKNLLALGASGVVANSMIPSFPSLTFPNHYTIVTGLYPAHHGLVDNSFYDRNKKRKYSMSNKAAVQDSSWYGGIPLWSLSEKQKMLSASFYWVGSEAASGGFRPTYSYLYNEIISVDRQIQVIKEWLELPEKQRPHLITFYLPQVDHAAHSYGPDSKQTGDAVIEVDDAIAKLVTAISTTGLPVNYIFVSDHGMIKVQNTDPILLPSVIDTSKFIISSGDAVLQLYAKDPNDIKPTYDQLKKNASDYDAYLTDSLPARWHYNKKDDRYGMLGDIMLIPKLPKIFGIAGRRITPGKHGFDPAIEEMHASFIAWGPDIKNGLTIQDFENIHVYPLIAYMLGLKYKHRIDGSLKVLKPILK